MTTIELIEQSTLMAGALRKAYLNAAAQVLENATHRLRELDKPDCVWIKDKHDYFNTQCGEYFDVDKRHYCPNCGGAVKEPT